MEQRKLREVIILNSYCFFCCAQGCRNCPRRCRRMMPPLGQPVPAVPENQTPAVLPAMAVEPAPEAVLPLQPVSVEPAIPAQPAAAELPSPSQPAQAGESAAAQDAPIAAGSGTPAAMPQGAPSSSPDMDQFLATNTEQGVLRVQAFRGRQAIPVPGVQVTVLCPLAGGDVVLFRGETDESGIIDPINLPAPQASQSLSPGGQEPGAVYTLLAEVPGFVPFRGTVKIYPGVKTVQPIQLQLQGV